VRARGRESVARPRCERDDGTRTIYHDGEWGYGWVVFRIEAALKARPWVRRLDACASVWGSRRRHGRTGWDSADRCACARSQVGEDNTQARPLRLVHAGLCGRAKFCQRGHGDRQNRRYAHNNGTRMVRSHEFLAKERQGLGPRVHACLCVWWFDQEDRALTPRLSKSRVLAAQPRRRHRLVDARGTN
jgi:hypothetical protein